MVRNHQQDESLTTTTGIYLLEGLKSPENRTVWQEFVCRYRIVVFKYACQLGLRDEEAEDAAQQTLLAFNAAYQSGKYDTKKGRLRHWLFGIARNQIRDMLRKRRERESHFVNGVDHTGHDEHVDDDNRLEELWEKQWREAVLGACLEEVRQTFEPKTIQAFELFAWKGWPVRRVAEHLDVSENAVFLARHRVLQRIRELVPQMEGIW